MIDGEEQEELRSREPDNSLSNASDDANANVCTAGDTNASTGGQAREQSDLAEAIQQEAKASMSKIMEPGSPIIDPRSILGPTLTPKFFDIVP